MLALRAFFPKKDRFSQWPEVECRAALRIGSLGPAWWAVNQPNNEKAL